jgi:hypothetical protein
LRRISPSCRSFADGLICLTSSVGENRVLKSIAQDGELIFPIKDAASAALMVIKADCRHNAGVISDEEKQWVHFRARILLANGTLKDAA